MKKYQIIVNGYTVGTQELTPAEVKEYQNNGITVKRQGENEK